MVEVEPGTMAVMIDRSGTNSTKKIPGILRGGHVKTIMITMTGTDEKNVKYQFTQKRYERILSMHMNCLKA